MFIVGIVLLILSFQLPKEKLNPRADRATRDEPKPLGKIKSETVPLTKEELIRSAMKALDQGDKELAKKFMDQAESMRHDNH